MISVEKGMSNSSCSVYIGNPELADLIVNRNSWAYPAFIAAFSAGLCSLGSTTCQAGRIADVWTRNKLVPEFLGLGSAKPTSLWVVFDKKSRNVSMTWTAGGKTSKKLVGKLY